VTATGQTERKRQSGNSTASIDTSTVNLATVSNFSEVLSSRAPGVVVQAASGQTGASSRIRIRGSNSISLSNDPLLIVDGVRVDNNTQSAGLQVGGQIPSRFNDINPEEIDNIEIIKGPAAAALYGTAAANGVIQVTTKKGRAGRTAWNVYGEAGNLHDVNDYPLNYRAFGHTAAGTLVSNCSLFARTSTTANRCVGVDSLITNDPLHETNAIQEGNRRTAGLSAAGGSDNATYYLSGEYTHEQNVIQVNHLNQLNLRTNLRSQLAKTLDAQLSVGYVNSDLRQPQNDNNIIGVLSGALLGKGVDCGPWGLDASGRNARYPTVCGGDTISRGYFNGQVPQTIFNINTRQQVRRVIGSLTMNYTPMTWLLVNTTLGADVNHRDDTETTPPGLVTVSQDRFDGSRFVLNGVVNNYTASVNGTATYDASEDMKFTTTLGAQYTDVYFNRADALGYKLLAGTSSLAGTNARFSVNEQTNDIRTLGYLGREQFAWRDRVFLTAGVRTDRNSAFGQNFARIFYPAFSASWVISEERFFPKLAALSSLRIRTAYGASGQNPGYLAAEQYFNPVAVVIAGVDVPAFTIGGAGNPDLKPERSTEVEGGFDLGLFQDRVSMEYTHYNKLTKNALVNVPIAPSVGTSATRFQNLGEVRNYGDEALLRATVYQSRGVTLDLTVNGTWTTNHLNDLGVDANGRPIADIVTGSNSTQIIRTGLPLGAYFQRPIVSITDLNGDGLIGCPGGPGSPTCEVVVGDSATYLGSFYPSNEISFTPALAIGKSLRITATLDHRGGQKLFNLTHYFRDPSQVLGPDVENPTSANLQQQGAAVAALFPANVATFAGYIENASFTKLREVAVTITLPQNIAARIRASNASLTLAGRNLHTWTSYSGLDPELNSTPNALGTNTFSTSDFLTLPQVRQLTARIALSF
jgi:TonB-linked SusC/RagA family outer membrane protein